MAVDDRNRDGPPSAFDGKAGGARSGTQPPHTGSQGSTAMGTEGATPHSAGLPMPASAAGGTAIGAGSAGSSMSGGTTSGTTASQAMGTGSTGSADGAGAMDRITGAASEAARQAADTARQTLDEARQQVADAASRATEQGKSLLSQQKDSAAGQLDSVAQAVRGAARQLHDEQPQMGRYVDMAADRLETLGRGLRDKDIDTLIGDVESLGRRSPGTLFVGAMAAGFFLARFLKASADRRSGGAALASGQGTGLSSPGTSAGSLGTSAGSLGTSTGGQGVSTSSNPANTVRPGGIHGH